ERAVLRDAWDLSTRCLQIGVNPAERLYGIAKALGYQVKASPQARLDMQAAGQRASTPTSGGGQGGGKLSLDALAKMNARDFAKATEGDNWRRLMEEAPQG